MTTTLVPAKLVDDLPGLVDRITGTDEILPALRLMRALGEAAAISDPEEAFDILRPLAEDHAADPLVAYLSVHALGGVASPRVVPLLVRLLAVGDPALSQYAAWSLSRRRPAPRAIAALEAMIEEGGFSKMMAELALENWLGEVPELTWQASRSVTRRLLELSAAPAHPAPARRPDGGGLRIAQILMQGRVDAGVTAAGSGDGGGLITLQVGLTEELARHDAVDDVYLLTRLISGESEQFSRRYERVGEGTLARLGFGEPGYVATADMWAHRADLERELRQFLITHGPFDALHLRFADVGTFVAARLGEQLGIPVFFTLAPDPHAVIAAAEESGALTRRGFAAEEARHHYLFRAWLVDWMLERAERLALLPRLNQREQFQDLLGVDVSEGERFKVIPEGVDIARLEDAGRVVASLGSGDSPGVIGDLERAIAAMPEHRQGLPLLLTVGRLNRVKGMDRVVAAWAGDSRLRSRYNLVVVGGNLEEPSLEESSTLSAIDQALDGEPPTGLVMLGSRTHDEVALIMAAAFSGTPCSIGRGGVYVAGSEKEEFGLAIVEAMAAGLPVVAPRVGGPATYIEHAFTGYLADTRDVADLRRGIEWADSARFSEVRADAARRKVRSEYSLAAMATGLVDLYRLPRAQPTAS